MSKTPIKPQLWTERPVEETISVYRDWAESYDADVTGRGYHTPARIAAALQGVVAPDTTILDFGCGTGVSGTALKAAGFTALHGTDITPEMLAQAAIKGVYEKLWQSQPGEAPPSYAAMVAVGVVSLGAAPPETLNLLVDALPQNGVLALSFNDPTLADGRYDAALEARLADGSVTVISRAHGPHLDDMEMGSDVIALRRA